jgi:hypothetical protein
VANDTLILALVQLNSGARTFLPYTAGLLQAVLQKQSKTPERYHFLTPLWRARTPVAQAVKHLQNAHLVGLSLYVWNTQRSLAIAKALKTVNPNCLILAGGPHVPDRAEEFLRQNPAVDLCVHGEGENLFVQIAEHWPNKPWSELNGLSWIDSNGQFQHSPRAPRNKNIQVWPSPYLSGIFEALLKAHPEEDWAALWETNRGCPFSCSYCDWGSATASKILAFDLPRLKAEIDWFVEQQLGFVFCCDANFGILPRDLELANYAANARERTGFPKTLAVQNSKNATERSYLVHKTLIQAGLDQDVTLSVQSIHPPVLAAIRRENISLQHYQELHKRLSADGIRTYTDVIIGLPGETYVSFAEGISQMISGGQIYALKFYNASLLPNAEMAQPAYREKYAIRSKIIPTVYLHSSAADPPDGILEYQELLIGCESLPEADWVRCLSFAWMTDLLFFGKHLLRPLLIYLNQETALSYRQILEAFLDPPHEYPLLAEISAFFKTKGQAIQAGDYEYCRDSGAEFSGIWWSADEFVLIRLLAKNQIGQYFTEVLGWLSSWLFQQNQALPTWLLTDLISVCRLNLQLAYRIDSIQADFQSNLLEVCQAQQAGQTLALVKKSCRWVKDWQGAPFSVRQQLL